MVKAAGSIPCSTCFQVTGRAIGKPERARGNQAPTAAATVAETVDEEPSGPLGKRRRDRVPRPVGRHDLLRQRAAPAPRLVVTHTLRQGRHDVQALVGTVPLAMLNAAFLTSA